MVYVDKLSRSISSDPYARKVGSKNGHLWCHMWADSLDELHEMALKIGMRREWFQDEKRLPHYDLTPGRRKNAVQLGAKEVGIKELAQAIRKNRGY